jgi:cell division protein FtsQ
MIATRRISLRMRVLAGALAAIAIVGGAWLWLRDSSLVAVRHVTIIGVAGPDAGQIRSALTLSARNMTTLDVRVGQLRTAVAPYPVVKDIRVSTQFPHGMRIRVVEDLPVGALVAGGHAVAVSGDGTVLHDVSPASLPSVPVALLPGGSQVTDRDALSALALLADAPPGLMARIAQVTTSPPHGLVVTLRSGPSLYFGDGSDLEGKWVATTEVLADPTSAGASYIDVTDPSRPAAGASPAAVAAAGLATGGAGGTTPAGQTSAATGGTSGVTAGTDAGTAGTGAGTAGTGTPQPGASTTSSGG